MGADGRRPKSPQASRFQAPRRAGWAAGLAAVGPAVSLSLRVGSAVGRHEQVQQESTSGCESADG